MYPLTNKNIRIRYLIEKENRKAAGDRFTYDHLAIMFDSDNRTVYTWVSANKNTQHLPASASKKEALTAWINDGTLERYFNTKKEL